MLPFWHVSSPFARKDRVRLESPHRRFLRTRCKPVGVCRLCLVGNLFSRKITPPQLSEDRASLGASYHRIVKHLVFPGRKWSRSGGVVRLLVRECVVLSCVVGKAFSRKTTRHHFEHAAGLRRRESPRIRLFSRAWYIFMYAGLRIARLV